MSSQPKATKMAINKKNIVIMQIFHVISLITRQISCIALTAVSAKSKYYEGEIRPYEFGYRIEGNQHRHEKKDANGIINGEFGFITGDGNYHQSVYATDENGNFKLISLKSSFRSVKPTTTTTVPSPATTISPDPALHSVQLPRRLKSCSNCRVVEEDLYDKSSPTAPDAIFLNRKGEEISSRVLKTDSLSNVLSRKNDKDALKKLSIGIETGPKTVVKSNSISPIIAPDISTAGIKAYEQMKLLQKERQELQKLKSNTDDENSAKIDSPSGIKVSQQVLLKPKEKDEHGKAIIEIPSHQISKLVIPAEAAIPVSLQTKSEISVPISIDDNIQTKSIQSSKTHLSSKQAINEFIGDILYRFNYTAGYHGHNEEGDNAGNKRGGYFIIGRDNIRRGVIYVANSNGFSPVIKYEKVSSEDAPHEDTEKSAGLQGYEFDWFHKGKSKFDNSSLQVNRR